MPTKYDQLAARHRAQAEYNQCLARDIVPKSSQWSTVIAFYAALHFLDQYAALRDATFDSHKNRYAWLKRCKELREIAPVYGVLQALSERARYQCPSASDEVNDPSVVETRIMSYVHQVRGGIDKALKHLAQK